MQWNYITVRVNNNYILQGCLQNKRITLFAQSTLGSTFRLQVQDSARTVRGPVSWEQAPGDSSVGQDTTAPRAFGTYNKLSWQTVQCYKLRFW